MSRPLRIQYPNVWYYVMNRGRRAEKIFSNKTDYTTFLVKRKGAHMEFTYLGQFFQFLQMTKSQGKI